MIQLNTLTPNSKNPRKISDEAMSKLCESIKNDPEFMVLRPIVVDKNNIILGGNQRYHACQKLGMNDIPDTWVKVADTLTPEQRKRFIIVDNAPEGMSGEWDFSILTGDWGLAELENLGFNRDTINMAELDLPNKADDNIYTGKIISPVYEPKGEKPPVNDLYDESKTQELIKAIDKTDLPDDIRLFLHIAASRHTVFNFSKIAEFYCHANPDVQQLMEQSGMVIIDVNKAIEYGFVHMTKEIGELLKQELLEDDAE